MCISCLREAHINHPFHRVYWWTGRHYRGSWLREAGVALYLCPNTPNGTPCPSNRAGFLAEIPSRVPTGLVDRRQEKGKAPRRGTGAGQTAGAARPAGAAQPAGAVPTAPPPESISVPRAPPLATGMDIDLAEETAGWREAESQALPATVPPETDDIDSELQLLYGAFDSQLDLQEDEPEEVVGGTDDTTHAPPAPETVPAAGANAAAGAAGAASDDTAAPRLHSAIPDYDLHGFTVLTLVHDNGVHGLGVNFCRCAGHLPEYEQLLMHGLFPASTKAPATAYDVGSLEKALVEEAECRTTSESWWKKIARLTEPEDPGATVVSIAIAWHRHLG